MSGGRVKSPHPRHPVAAGALLAVVALAGVFAFVRLRLSVPPHLDRPAVRVSIRDPGVPLSIMDRRIAVPLFHYLSRLRNLRDVRSLSREGDTRTTLVFENTAGLDRSLPRLHALLARTLPLPASAGRPVVVRFPAPDAVVAQVLVTAPTWPLADMRRWTEDKLMPQFLGLTGVAGAQVEGGPVREIRVVPDQRRLARLGLALDDVVATVRAGEAQSPPGYLVAAAGSGSAAVAALPVRLPSGNLLSLSQVAAVRADSHAGPDVRLNGTPAVRLVLARARGKDPLAVTDAIKARTDWLRANGLIPRDVQVHVLSTQARALSDMLRRFYVMALGTLVLVLVVVLFPARGMHVGIPQFLVALVALLASGTFLLIADMTLNLMDLGGLLVAVGLCLGAPLAMRRSAPGLASVRDDGYGVRFALGVILPMVMVLLVLLVVPGPIGLLFRDLIAVVIIAQCLSWVLAVTVLGAWPGAVAHPVIRRRGGQSTQLRYRSWIVGGAGKPLRSLVVAALALAGLLVGAVFLVRGTEFFPAPETAEARVRISATSVSGARRLEAAVPRIEQLAREQGGVAHVTSMTDAPPVLSVRLHIVLAGHPRAAAAQRWVAGFEQNLAHSALLDVQVRSTLVAFPGIGPGYRNAPLLQALDGVIGIEVIGPGGSALTRVGQSLARILRSQPQVRDVCISAATVTRDLVLHMNPVLAAERGISEAQATRALRIARGGLVVGTILEGERRRDIRVALAPDAGRVAALPRLLLRGETRIHPAAYLGDVATVKRVQQAAEIRRDQGQPVLSVTGVLAASGYGGNTVRRLDQRATKLKLPPGYRLSLAGVAAVAKRVSEELSVFALIALPMVTAALIWRYRGWRQPLVVLLSALYAVAGALVAMGLRERALSAPGWVGLILAAGVVAGLSVLIIDVMDWHLQRHGRRVAALAMAASLVRPVVLRLGAAAIAGAILLATIGAPEFALLQPLATAFLGGMTAGVAASILWTPVLYGMLLGCCGVLPAGGGAQASKRSRRAPE